MAWYLIFGYLYSKKYIFIPLRQSLSTPACKHAPKSRYGGACTGPVSKKKYNLKNLLYHTIAKYYKILHTSTNDSFYHPYSWNLAVLDGELSIPQSGGAWCPTCNAKVRVKVTTWRAPSSVFFWSTRDETGSCLVFSSTNSGMVGTWISWWLPLLVTILVIRSYKLQP